ncbi:sensor domain-containing diguanylate cyclase [Paenibacillus methanolicus]|uniref:Diguanylate cyclase (GGDEF)-like protein n=1 Tax=Paenibacillus methanolicus TaxID=582686 RepID=A0A5S5BV10_9BACL|nr:diguanylate cyclase [Paenibacillus methanolicus]TYP70794.1 diguanylate cyclase (GGDEF)-like protein [Paenibacillus methanolicus]
MFNRLYIPRHRFGRSIYIAVLTGGLLLILLVSTGLYWINQDFKESVRVQGGLHRYTQHLDKLRSSLIDQETGQRGFELTGEDTFLEPYETGTLEFYRLIAVMDVEGDTYLKASVSIQEAIKQGLYWHDYAEEQISAKRLGHSATTAQLEEGRQLFNEFRRKIDFAASVLQEEKDIAFTELQRSIGIKLLGFGIGAAAIIVLLITLLARKLHRDTTVLHQLSEVVRGFGDRQFDERLPARREQDDLYRLIAGIDVMRMELKLKFGKIEELALLDGLTGIPNRRQLDVHLAAMAEAAQSSGMPLSLLLCDIDHFKQFNDRFGHLEGDRVLRHTARVLQGGEAGSRFAFRYGGEEFCILLPGCDRQAAAEEAERLRVAVMEQSLPPYRLTMSFGAAQLSIGDDGSGEALIARADKALYSAKKNGRNRVES